MEAETLQKIKQEFNIMAQVSLESLFVNNQQTLKDALQGLTIPKDADKIQTVISNFLSQLLLDDGEFRQNLTQSEDYVLESALSILTAQQEIYAELSRNINTCEKKVRKLPTKQELDNQKSRPYSTTDTLFSLTGAASGSLAGKIILGGWGAVFGAIAGVAVAAYISSCYPPRRVNETTKDTEEKTPIVEIVSCSIDIECFINIIRKICECVDNLIGTYRAQINRVVQKYESMEKPTLEREYRTLLEGIQTLIGFEKAHCDDEKFVTKLHDRFEDFSELLENYNLAVVDYSEEKLYMFDEIPSSNIKECKQSIPAIAKGEQVVLKGKIFVPYNK